MIAEEKVMNDIKEEYIRAVESNGEFHSAHEGFAVILEELDELRTEVWKKKRDRDRQKMYKEAMQIGAMAMRFMIDVCMDERGNLV